MAIGKAFDMFVLIVRADTFFIRFMGPMGPTAGSVIGAPIPLLAGAIDSRLNAHQQQEALQRSERPGAWGSLTDIAPTYRVAHTTIAGLKTSGACGKNSIGINRRQSD